MCLRNACKVLSQVVIEIKEVMSLKKNSISVFFPAFNDEGSIVTLVEDALKVLPALTNDYEVIVVNDGSTDSTKVLLDGLAQRSKYVKIIHHSHNRGYGAALITGFRHASKEFVFYTDGDGQFSVQDLTKMVPLMDNTVDAVNGFKVKRADGLHRILIGNLYNFLAKLFFNIPIRDVDCDFRLIRLSAIRKIDLVSSSGIICVELVRRLHASGCRFAEVPVNHYPRRFGRSQFFTPLQVARLVAGFFTLWVKLVLWQKSGNSKRAF